MGSPKSKSALERLGSDIRGARLRRGIAVADLAVRAGTSPSSVVRLEKGGLNTDYCFQLYLTLIKHGECTYNRLCSCIVCL